MGDVVAISLIVVLLLFAAFLAMAEYAITRVGRAKAYHLDREKKSSNSRALVKIIDDPAPFLNVVLLLMLVAQLTGTALATGIAINRFGSVGAVIAAALMTFLVFVFVEIIPKSFAIQHPERAGLLMARPVVVLGRLLQPVGKLLILISNAAMAVLPGRGMPKGPFVTEDEIRHIVDVAEQEEEIEHEERELIHSIFEFGDTIVREVMVPRTDMIAIEASATLAQALETIVEAGYSRIPIYEEDTDNIVGLLYAKDLLRRSQNPEPDARVSSVGRAPLFVPEQKRVSDLLRHMQEERVHMAIVVDEYGGTAGLVTIEDLIEEIVGEIVDEYDQEEPLVEPIDENTMRVDAKMLIDEVNELLDADLPHEEWDTVGGLVFELTGRIPVPGEVVSYDSLEFRTERVNGRRIQKIVISRTAASPDGE